MKIISKIYKHSEQFFRFKVLKKLVLCGRAIFFSLNGFIVLAVLKKTTFFIAMMYWEILH